MEGEEVWNCAEDPFFFFVCFSLFETTEICLGCTKMENLFQEKAYFTPGKNQEKVKSFAPSEKHIPLRPLYTASLK